MLAICDMASKVSVVRTSNKGRAVIADELIPAGTLIERSPTLFVDTDRTTTPDGSNFDSYLFRWPSGFVLALGHGGLFNHSFNPNARFTKLPGEEAIEFHALREIAKGEEILIDYCQDSPGKPLWFEPVE